MSGLGPSLMLNRNSPEQAGKRNRSKYSNPYLLGICGVRPVHTQGSKATELFPKTVSYVQHLPDGQAQIVHPSLSELCRRGEPLLGHSSCEMQRCRQRWIAADFVMCEVPTRG